MRRLISHYLKLKGGDHMASDTRTEKTPVEDSQAGAMSTPEQTPAEESVEPAAPTEVTGTAETEELALPDDAKDRTTEQFDKLKEQLRDERVRREEAETAYSSQYLQQQPVAGNQQKPIYDAATGYVDVDELERLRSTTAKAQASATRSDRKLEKYIVQQQKAEAFAVYPELDTKSKDHDSELAKMSNALITASMMNPKDYSGELTLKQAADMIRGMSDRDRKAAEKVGAAKAVEELTPKEQASLEATGRSDRRTDVEVDYSELRGATRRGSKEATIARLRALSASD
jgi:hypothetical protein